MNKEDGIFKKNITIQPRQCDSQGRITPGALACILEHAAAEHLRQYDLGAEVMRKHGLLWVLVKRAVQIERLPVSGEKIFLETWTGKEHNWLYPKRFRAQTPDGEKLIEAACQWTLMDSHTRAINPPTKSVKSMPSITIEGEMKDPAWTVPFPELTECVRRVVDISEIDHNGHLNNSCYLDWAAEILDKEFHRNHQLEKIWIEYNRELVEGQEVVLHYHIDENTLYVKGQCELENTFSAVLTYRTCPIH